MSDRYIIRYIHTAGDIAMVFPNTRTPAARQPGLGTVPAEPIFPFLAWIFLPLR